MRYFGVLVAASFLLNTCSAGVWGEEGKNVDPLEAEKGLPESPTSKYDYKLSFKEPYYYNKTIPFWSTGGDVLHGEDFIRLSPSIPNSQGWIWSEVENPYEEWEAEVAFKVTGTHMHGGRGLAFWYSKESKQTGPIFGSQDRWDGLSVWLDSANPVNHKASTMALLNDGSITFAVETDPRKRALGACSITYRNSPNPTFLKVVMKDSTLSVFLDNNGKGNDYRMCLQKSGIKLPTGYYFGVSSYSHTPADDHDIFSFETKQLNPPQKLTHTKRPLEEEKKKRGEEFSGIDEEQKEKIKEAEYQMRKLKDTGGNMNDEAAATMTAIYDTQVRTLEDLQLLHLQVEALGAPSLSTIVSGDYENANLAKNDNTNAVELNRRIEDIYKEATKNTAQFARISNDQNRQIQFLQDAVHQLQQTLSRLDMRLSSQSDMIHAKMSEVNSHSAETKGTIFTVFKYIFYIFLVQILIVFAGYLYSKLRVNSNDKKFV